MNTYLYEVVALVLQSAQAHNITFPEGEKYNVPSENITDPTPPAVPGTGPVSNLTAYSMEAIAGADDFRDNQTTIKDIFDIIVQTTREITPTGMLSNHCLVSVRLADPVFRIKSGPCGLLGTCRRKAFSEEIILTMASLSYNMYKWPTRSVEQLPPYTPRKLRNRVILIGNSVRTLHLSNRNHPTA